MHLDLSAGGEDQLPHLELTRETARHFNRNFKPIFPEPQALLGRAPRLVGTDGNAKMSKSRGNTIDLKDSVEIVASKVRRMYGGPPRGAKEPGKVEQEPALSVSRCVRSRSRAGEEPEGALRAHRREQRRIEGSADSGPE